MLELIVASVAATAIVSFSIFIVNNQRQEVLTTQSRAQGSQNLRVSLDLMGTDIQLAGERLHNNADLPVIQLFNGNGGNTPAGFDQLVVQRRLIAASLLTCEPLGDNDTSIVVADSTVTDTFCTLSDVGPDTDGDEAIANPDSLSDIVNEFKDYRCLDAAPSDCDRNGPVPATAADCVSDAKVTNGCVVAYIVDPNNGFGEFFYYTNEACTGECAEQINGEDDAAIKNSISAIPLETVDGTGSGTDWNHPNNEYPVGSRIYILEERHYRLNPPNGDESGVLEMVLNNEDDYAQPSAGPNGGEAIRLVNQIEALNIEIQVPSPTGGLQTITEYNTAPNLIPGQLLYDRWVQNQQGTNLRSVQSIQLYVEASQTSESDQITLPKGGCNFAPFNQFPPYNGAGGEFNGPEDVPGLCIATKYYPRNAFSSDL